MYVYVKWALIVVIVIVLLVESPSVLWAQDGGARPSAETTDDAQEETTRAEKIAAHLDVARKLESSMAVLEISLKYDKGEEPYERGYVSDIPRSLDSLVKEERPAEIPAYVLSEKDVICPDLNVHDRFIETIVVRKGDQVVEATAKRYFRNQYAVIYETAEPLKDVTPLAFDADADGPYLIVSRHLASASWRTAVSALPSGLEATAAWGSRTSMRDNTCLITTEDGTPVGMCMNGELPADETWKGSPLDWKGPSAKALADLLAATEEKASGGIYRVTLQFRSPRKQASGPRYSRYMGDGESETEKQSIGVLTDEATILILANLKPKVTARLERILVNRPDGEPIAATFTHTLKDYGGLLARLDEPVGKPITFGDKDIRQYLNLILPASEIMIRGEEVVRYMQHIRIPRFEFGWRRHVYPDTFGPNSNTFIFGTDGTLLALPVVKRETVSSESRYRSGYPRLTATTYLREALADIDANIDPSNVPLTEQEEARLAWLGVELQPMDPELARANEVSDLTQNGRHGALVTYVYPASPAAEKGLKPGDILLRLFVEGEPKPLDVSIDDMAGYYSRGPFPWEQLDQVPEQYYDRIPRPWPPAENSLTRKLTDLGFGKRFEAQIYSGGERRKVPFEVVQSPKHHDTAEKFKSEDLGITVRNLTYEVRRFFRREDDEPGVIVSKIEPGSKASVAGIRPFEIITHVNDEPVGGVADFEKLVAPGGELRFSVKRWTKGRVVKMEGEMPEPEPDGEALGDGDTGQADGAETVDDDTAASTTDADAAPDTRDDTP